MKKYWYIEPKQKALDNKKRRIEARISSGKYLSAKHLKPAMNSLYRLQLFKKATKEEIIFGDWMWNKGINFKFQKGFLVPFHRIVDFYIPEKRLIIEIDGGYHKNTKYFDDHKDRVWFKRKFSTIRILNEEILDGSFIEKYGANI